MSLRINYKTPQAVRTLHNLKVSIKNNGWNFEKMITKSSPELRAKRKYMQSNAFWNDEHNKKMIALCDELIKVRDKITQNIIKNNAIPQNNTQIQDVNGFARIKKFWNPASKSRYEKRHFVESVSVGDRENYDYSFLKTKIYNLSREFLSKIGR